MGESNRPSAARVWLARGIAIAADLLQIGLFPYFAEGAISPLDAGLDVLVGVVLVLLVGWHIAFVPTFIVEMLPFADLAPTWTLHRHPRPQRRPAPACPLSFREGVGVRGY